MRLRRFLLVFSLIVTLPIAAQNVSDETAATDHWFPLVMDGGGFWFRLFIVNADAISSVNQCELTLHGFNSGTGNLSPHVALTMTDTGGIVQLTDADAGIVISSNDTAAEMEFGFAFLECAFPVVVRGMQSAGVAGNPNVLTALESVRPTNSFQLSALPRFGSLEFAVVNTGANGANCSVTLADGNGAELSAGALSVPAHSQVIASLESIFDVPASFSDLEDVVAEFHCDGEVAAAGMPASGATFYSLPAIDLRNVDSSNSFYVLPLVAAGGGFHSLLWGTNLAMGENSCAFVLRGVGLNGSETWSLARKGDLAVREVPTGNSLAIAWATLDCDDPAAAHNLLSLGATGEELSLAVIPGVRTAKAVRFPMFPGVADHALVLSNPFAEEASCSVSLRGFEGEVNAPVTVAVPALELTPLFVSVSFAPMDQTVGGVADVSCNREIAAVSLPLNGAAFAAIPPVILTESGSGLRFAIRGNPGDQYYFGSWNGNIEPLTLPAAGGGDGMLSYSLSPDVPGLRFDADTRKLSGVPAQSGSWDLTYTVADGEGETESIRVLITALDVSGNMTVEFHNRPELTHPGTIGVEFGIWNADVAPTGGGGMFAADFDGDGDDDVVFTDGTYPGEEFAGPKEGAILINQGDYSFTVAAGDRPNSVHPREVLMADFNGDGRNDLFIADHGYDVDPFPGWPNQLLLATETGYEDVSYRLPNDDKGFTHNAAVGDVDGDGDIDILVANNGGEFLGGVPYLLFNDGSAHFTADQSGLPDRVVDYENNTYRPWAVDMRDLDGDGHVDLLMGNSGRDDSFHSYIYWGPDFDHATDLPASDWLVGFGEGEVISTAVHDIDGDGRTDILLGGYNNDLNRGLQILINAGDRVFQDQTRRRLGSSAWSTEEPWQPEYRFLDFNGDGTLDIVPQSYSYENGNVLAWLNDGTGHYAALKTTMFSDAEALYRLTVGVMVREGEAFKALEFFPHQGGLHANAGVVVEGARITLAE